MKKTLKSRDFFTEDNSYGIPDSILDLMAGKTWEFAPSGNDFKSRSNQISGVDTVWWWESDMFEKEEKIIDPSLDSISETCSALARFLQAKNKNYGDSARNPMRVFSKADSLDGMLVRMDDKLSRIKNSSKLKRNDCIDLMGYLMLYCTAQGWTDFDDMID